MSPLLLEAARAVVKLSMELCTIEGLSSMNLTSSDRSSLLRLAASLPAGDESRRAILAGLRESASRGVHPLAGSRDTLSRVLRSQTLRMPKIDSAELDLGSDPRRFKVTGQFVEDLDGIEVDSDYYDDLAKDLASLIETSFRQVLGGQHVEMFYVSTDAFGYSIEFDIETD